MPWHARSVPSWEVALVASLYDSAGVILILQSGLSALVHWLIACPSRCRRLGADHRGTTSQVSPQSHREAVGGAAIALSRTPRIRQRPYASIPCQATASLSVGRVSCEGLLDLRRCTGTLPDLRLRCRRFSSLRSRSKSHVPPMCLGDSRSSACCWSPSCLPTIARVHVDPS